VPPSRRPSTRRDLDAVKDRSSERRRIEGIAFVDAGLRQSISGVDFIDCDMTGMPFDKPRFGQPITVEDCTFTACDWGTDGYPGAIANTRLLRCSFVRCTFSFSSISKAAIEDCRFERGRFEGLYLHASTLVRVVMVDAEIQKCHWANSAIGSTVVAGRARTLVISDTRLVDVDLSGLRMIDCDLGRRLGEGVRFPATPECFVVPGAALVAAAEALTGRVSPAALASYRLMSSTLMADYVVIDASLFRHAPDLPDMDTTPADVDAILGTLWRSHVTTSDGMREG
jgi:uncharacterized protein YjbI with pentapeptide repeats